ncbi:MULTISPECIES: BrnA antitoxin family protein [unclassified Caballeronia]|uniref:BrnA antitoxin family protein n=1 Tax=unclassified Caballeronia TaxID=2646786 RepID=UPI002866C04F|nr:MULTISPECIES: BrnA antitoxin family protein [unclassified Caballeronia]MDR5739768.1 BrnA antitoxin family protein [Caballeronia sp. LZ016]MDR5808233.1 BrnA antitoxin family protein [Caballeronia sp. LZ019]
MQRGIRSDPATFVPSDALYETMTRRIGRPPSESPKVQLTVRYDADIVAAFRAGGAGWQTRMNDALREWLREHPVASGG